MKWSLILFLIIVVVGVIVGIIQDMVDDTVCVKSGRAVENYDYIKYFKEDRNRIQKVEKILVNKQRDEYKVRVKYTSPSGRVTTTRVMPIHLSELKYVQSNPSVVMSSAEYKVYKQIEKDKEKALKEEQRKREQAIKDKMRAESAVEREKLLLEKDKERKERDKLLQAEREKERLVKEAERAAERERTQQQRQKERLEKEKIRQAEREKVRLEKEALLAKQRAMLASKQREYYEKVNEVIDYSSIHKENLVIQSDKYEIDRLVGDLYDRAYKVIKKAKSVDSGEWDLFDLYISNEFKEIKKIVGRNMQILAYYDSPEFKQIKDTCNALMDSQREFNEYIDEKARSIAGVFGSRVVRDETETIYKADYFRPYKKTITPFTAEVSKAVFSSAENDPIEYIIKYFYKNKHRYPEQIQQLQLLIGELETLKEAKIIIEDYKKDYQQYLTNVPAYVMENDEDGFYERLGFANLSESALTIEYRFTYTSDGGMVQKTFPVSMTEETITSLIDRLESKLTIEAFTKEQRSLMTQKLRKQIKERDNYTCKECGNSTYKEPNLLLEIDHIRPISKGGSTIESNLQTLCWKCNRAKSNRIT